MALEFIDPEVEALGIKRESSRCALTGQSTRTPKRVRFLRLHLPSVAGHFYDTAGAPSPRAADLMGLATKGTRCAKLQR
jgi:hypothetical protein